MGVGLLGLVVGLAAGIFLSEMVAIASLALTGVPWGSLFAPIGTAVVGAVAAPLVDAHVRRRRGDGGESGWSG